MTDDDRGGPVDSDVSYFREDGTAIIRYPSLPGTICHRCGSGEVWQPLQTMNMPIVLSCLRCGVTAPSETYV